MANDTNRPPDRDATVMMSSTALKRPDPPKLAPSTAANRLVYLVRPAGEQWEVVAGEEGGAELHATKSEALLAARSQARERWSAHGQPSRVTLEVEGGATQMVALYGSDIPFEKPA
jgi:hypothetical protein